MQERMQHDKCLPLLLKMIVNAKSQTNGEGVDVALELQPSFVTGSGASP
jgi:hypothetical protein